MAGSARVRKAAALARASRRPCPPAQMPIPTPLSPTRTAIVRVFHARQVLLGIPDNAAHGMAQCPQDEGPRALIPGAGRL